MAYTHTTRATFRTELATRLHDTGNVYWSASELNDTIDETLLTWGAVSEYWKGQGTFNTAAGTVFYNLAASLALLTPTITDTYLTRLVQAHLLEPNTGINWTGGTEMFALAQVSSAMERRRDQWLLETGQIVTHSTQAVGAFPSDGRVALTGDDTMTVRRVCWQNGVGDIHYLDRSDEYGMQHWDNTWSTAGSEEPEVYSVYSSPTDTIQLMPVHNAAGTLDLLTIDTGATLDPANGVVPGILENWIPFLKWGTLADLLGKDGPGRDPTRAAYCEERYRQGVELAKISGTILSGRIAGTLVDPYPLAGADMEDPYWQGKRQQAPTELLVAAPNLVALRPPPDGVYTITVDCVRDVPLPADDAGYIDVAKDHLALLLDYAEHLCAFKMGGAEFDATKRQADNFFLQAARHSRREKAEAILRPGLQEHAQRERAHYTPQEVTEGRPGRSPERY